MSDNAPVLSEDLHETLETAIRIATGANYLVRADGVAEITNCGSTQTAKPHNLSRALDLVSDVRRYFMTPNGYSPPLDSEAILRIQEEMRKRLWMNFSGKKLRVAFLQNGETGCAYWRCLEPARLLNEKYGETFYAESNLGLDYQHLMGFDVIVVQRGLYGEYVPTYQSVIHKLKTDLGKTIIYEVDDDLDSVHPGNTAITVMNQTTRRFVNWLKNESDAIFVTTERLSQIVGFPEKTFVLPNSLDFKRFRKPKPVEGRQDFITILWHGGTSHDTDIDWLGRYLIDIIEHRRVDWQKKTGKTLIVKFFGYLPEIVRPYMQDEITGPAFYYGADPLTKDRVKTHIIKGNYNIRFFPPEPVYDFHQSLVDLEPDICICPLNPSLEFNDGKSNIKFLESALAGSAVVVTNSGPFKDLPHDVCLKAKSPSDFFQAVQRLVYKEDERKTIATAGFEFAKKNFDLQNNCELWLNALCKVTGKRPSEIRGNREVSA